jgi:hypothetical protein
MSKRKAKTRITVTTNYFDSDEIHFDIRQTDEFAEFKNRIENALQADLHSIREIMIGAKTRNHYWFALAIRELVSEGKAVYVAGYIDKYKRGEAVSITPLAKVSRHDYGYNFLGK